LNHVQYRKPNSRNWWKRSFWP